MGENHISIFSLVKKILAFLKNLAGKANAQIYLRQVRLARLIKRHRTVKLIHLVRNYSAVSVVFCSAVLVSVTNATGGAGISGSLFEHWAKKEAPLAAGKMGTQADHRESIIYAPLAKSRLSVNPQLKEEEEIIVSAQPSESLYVASSAASPRRDPQENGGVVIYTVKEGDTISAIAAKHNITANTILWANDIDDIDSIMPGDQLFILPVAGVKHVVASGDTLDAIAKKYKADKEKIIAFNELPADGAIREGDEIIIPGGEKEIPRPAPTDSYLRQYATTAGGTPTVSGWRKLEGKAGTGHKFPYGYCTWYVSQRRYVPWGGNAGAWLYNAKAMGYYTGKTPKVGAIIVTTESWWGHVGIVEKVSGSSVTISEMNYERWGKVNRRALSAGSRAIRGYIY